MPTEPSPSKRALHLFVLGSFAVAQPLFDVLARDAAFFVARGTSPLDLWIGIGALLAGPVVLGIGLEWVVGRFSERASLGLHHGLVALLVTLIALPIVRAIDGAIAFAVAGAIGVAFAVVAARVAALRTVLDVLVVAPPIFVFLFVSNRGVSQVLDLVERTGFDQQPIESEIPIVLVVFDALPLSSLLDEDGGIDASLYPNFAELAATSTWFRNATTVDWATMRAVPAILTGRRPDLELRLPNLYEYPKNLFTWLDDDYEMNVHQTYTELSPTPRRSRAWDARVRSFASDVGILYLHVVLPRSHRVALPDAGRDWQDFGGDMATGFEGRPARFRHFLETMGSKPASLHFIHAVLPHLPFRYLPSGDTYYPFHYPPGSEIGPLHWSLSEPLVWDAQQRHLLQLVLVDRLIGELEARMAELGLRDRALLVVTADHGESFWPGDKARSLEGAHHPEDILTIPLFIRRPGQTTGEVDRRNVETIDILPAIADVIDAPLPWKTDGCSPFDPACRERPEKIAISRIATELRSERLRFDPEIGFWRGGVRRRLAHFGPGLDGLYRFGPWAELVGRPLASLRTDALEGGVFELERPDDSFELSNDETFARVRVAGTVDVPSAGEPPWIAIATHGVIRTVAQAARKTAEEGGGLRLASMVPEDAAFGDAASLRLFVVGGSPTAPVLSELATR